MRSKALLVAMFAVSADSLTLMSVRPTQIAVSTRPMKIMIAARPKQVKRRDVVSGGMMTSTSKSPRLEFASPSIRRPRRRRVFRHLNKGYRDGRERFGVWREGRRQCADARDLQAGVGGHLPGQDRRAAPKPAEYIWSRTTRRAACPRCARARRARPWWRRSTRAHRSAASLPTEPETWQERRRRGEPMKILRHTHAIHHLAHRPPAPFACPRAPRAPLRRARRARRPRAATSAC